MAVRDKLAALSREAPRNAYGFAGRMPDRFPPERHDVVRPSFGALKFHST